MIRLKELLELPIFQNFRLVAGLTGLSREVRNVDILEYEWMSRNFDVFHPDDLVLTSLFFAKDDPSLIQKSFEKLAARAVTAIASTATIRNSHLQRERRRSSSMTSGRGGRFGRGGGATGSSYSS